MCMLPVQLPGEHIQRHMLVPLSERRCASTHYLLGTVIKSASLTPRLQLNWLPLVALVIHLIQAMWKPGCCFVCVQYTGCFGTCWWKKCGLHQLTFFIARRVAEWQGFWESCKTSACHSQQIVTEVIPVIIMAAFGPLPPSTEASIRIICLVYCLLDLINIFPVRKPFCGIYLNQPRQIHPCKLPSSSSHTVSLCVL